LERYGDAMDVGDLVPDFVLTDQHGASQHFYELLGDSPGVIFFYPAALTPGCTKEACHFRDLRAEFDEAGVRRIGISRDKVEKQKRFDDEHDLGYPLLSDPDGETAKLFGVQRGGVLGKLGMPPKRWTFAIGADRRVAAVIKSETDMRTHADSALQALRVS
jgi:peroxiredoxin Q/BCP